VLRRLSFAAVLLLALGTLAACASVPGSPEDLARFSEQTVMSGLSSPTRFQFAPDGRVFVAEKSGIIKVFDGVDDRTPTTFADLRTNTYDFWDRGLLGMVLDPAFPTRPYVYVLYTYDAPPGEVAPYWHDDCPTPPGPDEDGCLASGRLSRLTAAGNVMTGPEQVLITDWCTQYPSHSTGDLAFGPDGKLYVSAGDGAAWTFADWGQAGVPRNPCGDPPSGVGGIEAPPAAEGGALRSQDPLTVGDSTGLDGAILRLDPDTGAAAAGNPAGNSSDANTRRIIAYGLRNPFRITFRPGTSELWAGDVGWSQFEEIERLDNPTSRVRNFGWPCYEGNVRQPSYAAAGLNICKALYAFPAYHDKPYVATAHAGPFLDGKTCITGTTSTSGLAFYNGTAYPAGYKGVLFVADYARNCIWMMLPGADGLPDPSTMRAFRSASGPVDLKIGPDGSLYYVDIVGGKIRRIVYTPNRPPTAAFDTDVTSGAPPLTVQFDGSGSHDNDTGQPLRYQWDLDGDGQFDDGSAVTVTWTYNTPGVYHPALKVVDPNGASDVATSTITVDVDAPVAHIAAPTADLHWRVGTKVSFSGSATDAGNGAQLPASTMSWTLIVHHCPEVDACHTHDVQSWNGVASGSFVAPDHEYPSYLELRLTARNNGLVSTESVRLDPETTLLSFDSNPTGLDLAVGSASERTPFTRQVIVGSRTSISAPLTAFFKERQFQFLSWSDGGAASHLIVAPSSDTTYVASYASDGDRPPVANAGPDITAARGVKIDISGAGSTDPEGGSLTYIWTQLSGPVVFAAVNGSTLSVLTPSQPAVIVFQLEVHDPTGLSDTDEVVITVP
jgi:glucose/arabinose dehydrogenase